MGIEEIPKSYRYTCDRCGDDHLQVSAAGHYTDSRPLGWGRLKMNRGGSGDSSKSFEHLLCHECSGKMAEAISRMMAIANPTERA